jgi:drug/metabolite transporter (DMT)-like permease
MASGNGSVPRQSRAATPGAVWSALAAVYVVWGSTYLAIRVAVETLPPLLMASVRFLIAGAVLYAWAARGSSREERPTAAQWRAAAIIGTALLLGGNGGVVLAEQTVPSGIAALLIATVPLWMVLVARLTLGERVGWRESLGIGVGFGGIVLLVDPFTGGGFDPVGVALLLFASLSWSAGSLYARRAPLPARPLLGTAMQMLAGGVALGVAGLIAGEAADFRPASVSLESLLGLGFLIVFGSLVGYTAYAWLLRATRTSLVATYAYVNPVVAVLLGWAILAEPLTLRTLVAGAVIVVGVALIVTAQARRKAEVPAAGEGDGLASEEARATSGSGSGTRGSTLRSR